VIIAIDGSSRRNGKPDCLAAGGVFIKQDDVYHVAAAYEKYATNQRGEMHGLVASLSLIDKHNPGFEDVILVTDSEYIFNAVYKDWLGNWERKNWKTADNSDVKNQDLWKQIHALLQARRDEGHEINIYHIKGHLLSLGKVTARNSLYTDKSGKQLFDTLWAKYDEAVLAKPDDFELAKDLFSRNHGFRLDEPTFKLFVVMNTVADYVAGTHIDNIDQAWIR
jgi:ribonuclease HI